MKTMFARTLFPLLLVLTALHGLAQTTYGPYTFTTLAGSSDLGAGSVDGTGSNAQFNYPQGVAVDNAGNVYVADTGNSTIRKVTPAGVVTTLAGLTEIPGSADGIGSAAQFNHPRGVAVDSAGNVYVADTGNFTIRKVTRAGVVTTLAGLAPQYDSGGNLVTGGPGSADGTGNAARFGYGVAEETDLGFGPNGVAVDGTGNVYVADTGNHTIRKVAPTGEVTTLGGLGAVPAARTGREAKRGSAARKAWQWMTQATSM